MDFHGYLAWSNDKTVEDYCKDIEGQLASVQIGYEVWMGEWSLATDTCAHWLGGFNDR